jgi:hypothetical protein
LGRSRKGERKSSLITLLFFVFLVALLLMYLGFSDAPAPEPRVRAPESPEFDAGHAGQLVLLFLIACTCVFVFLRVRARAHGKKTIQARNPFLGTRTFDLGPDTLAMHGEGYRIEVAWPMLQTVVVTPQALWLLYAPLEGWYIPREAIGDHLDTVIAFCRARHPGVVVEGADAKPGRA